MLEYLLVALGGALGSMARWGLSSAAARHFGDAFPWGTMIVNVSGSLLIGLLAAVAAHPRLSTNGRSIMVHLLIVGLCGGYTTFSAFSLQTFSLLQTKQYLAAGANVLGSAALCLLFVALGHWVGSLLLPAAST